ncbi:LapA family protein [Desulfovibrio sp. OttesenSCG-928-F07]|nr:LapA family protein [Desulfovibrio sp. OttesenSCG-928-F07]
MRFIKYFVQLVCLIIIVMFFIENSTQLIQKIQFKFDLFIPGMEWTFPEFPLYFLLLMTFALGALLAILSFAWGRWCIGHELRKANNKIRKLEKEIKAYRQLSLGEDGLIKKEQPTPPQQI